MKLPINQLILWVGLAAALPGRAEVDFNRDIRPLLSDNCFACHGPDGGKRKARLRLDLQGGATADRGGYAAVVPGNPGKSELVRRILSQDPDEMMPPPDSLKRLSGSQKQRLVAWVREGARWADHWVFVALEKVTPPKVKNRKWPQNAIDNFILARLESEGLKPSPEADPRTLFRRLHFDLVGLPPTPAELEAFLADPSPDAYEKAVDHLLSSPQYGERMATPWLDLVRYGDTVGIHGDQTQSIWPYRDYVIKAFNQNLPFNQFTIEQLAGDLLPGASTEQKIASGFNRLNLTTEEGGAQDKEYLAKYAADRVRAVSTVWMGATLGCAECHDHKFDPYATKDFYRFAAFFSDLQEVGAYKGGNGVRPPELPLPSPQQAARLKELESAFATAVDELNALKPRIAAAQTEWETSWTTPDPQGDKPSPVPEKITKVLAAKPADRSKGQQQELADWFARSRPEFAEVWGRHTALKRELDQLQQEIPRTLVSVAVEPRVTRVLHRGDWMDATGEVVTPGVPDCFKQVGGQGRRATRRDLAQWLVSPDNPMTARVFVNRLWKMYFGTGLSKVLDDLGSRGEWPSHPELLDFLALEFQNGGWDVKQMVSLIVTSATYRQSSLMRPELQDRDPFNRLLARQSRFRLPAEMVRDNALQVSGLLVPDMGGPGVKPYQPDGYWDYLNFPKRTYVTDTGRNQYRRGVYTHWQRLFLHPMLKAFDAPSREECAAERPVSNTPLAALALLNDPTFVEAARSLAELALQQSGLDTSSRLDWIFRRALNRVPNPDEREQLRRLLAADLKDFKAHPEGAEKLLTTGLRPVNAKANLPELAAWTSVCRAVLNLHETIVRF